MSKRSNVLLGLVSAAVLTGCASGPAFTTVEPPPVGQGQVYIYRPWQFPGGAASLKVIQDGTQTDKTVPNSSWQRLVVPPGRHGLGLREYLNTFSCGGVEVDVAEGQTVFVGIEFSFMTTVGPTSYVVCKMERRDEERALKDIAGMRRSD